MELLFFVLAGWLLFAGIVGLFKPGLVLRWGPPETKTRGKAFGLYTMLGCVCFILFAVLVPEQQSSTPDQTPKMQSDFVASVNEFIDDYERAANAIQKTELRSERGRAMLSVLDQQLEAHDWIGTIETIETQTDGDAFLVVKPERAKRWTVNTWNNGLSDIGSNTIIKSGSPVHDALRSLKEGDQVVFSGTFFHDDRFGLKETSMTEEGSMVRPEFLFLFSSIDSK